ncbi:hypothetical protein FI667_g6465, partial [Globisporangium splendens]
MATAVVLHPLTVSATSSRAASDPSCDDDTWFFELQPATTLPTADLSLAVNDLFLSARALEIFNKIMRRPLFLFVFFVIGALLYTVMLLLRVDRVGMIVAQLCAFGGIPAGILGADRATPAFTSWIGTVPNILVNVNLRAMRSWAIFSISSMDCYILTCTMVAIQLVDGMRAFTVLRYKSHELPAASVLQTLVPRQSIPRSAFTRCDSEHVVIQWTFRALGVTALLLFFSSLVLELKGKSDHNDADPKRSSMDHPVLYTQIDSLGCTIAYCGTCMTLFQHDLFVALRTSFDFAFFSFQTAIAHICACDIFLLGPQVHRRVDLVDLDSFAGKSRCSHSNDPVQLRLHKSFVFLVLVSSARSICVLACLLTFARTSNEIHDRVLWNVSVFGKVSHLRVVPIFYNSCATALAWFVR